jgi:hypothetical protein
LEVQTQLANRVIDPDQISSRFRPTAVYGDESSYPDTIFPWLGTLCLLNDLALPDALRHAGFGGAAGAAGRDHGDRVIGAGAEQVRGMTGRASRFGRIFNILKDNDNRKF